MRLGSRTSHLQGGNIKEAIWGSQTAGSDLVFSRTKKGLVFKFSWGRKERVRGKDSAQKGKKEKKKLNKMSWGEIRLL